MYITSQLADNYYTEAKGYAPRYENFNGLPADAAIYLPYQYMDYYTNPANYYAGENGENAAKMYPMLEYGTKYRTFSFDKPVDLSSITGLNNSRNKLEAYSVSAVDKTTMTATMTPVVGEVVANEGVVIKGTGTRGEFYPIRAAAGEPVVLATNYMKGNSVAATDISGPVGNQQQFFIMNSDGQFFYCLGGTLARYKAYLDLGEMIDVSGAAAKVFNMLFTDATAISLSHQASQDRAVWYTLSGQRLQGDPTTKGLYIVNGKKVTVK